ncbi:aldo/keto reductase [Georgenia phoenicis]|uniref:aldo/keto reductase n=1 Tax=unclassified Georgenia TaxID=2626815 RepID=UPI0039AF9D26
MSGLALPRFGLGAAPLGNLFAEVDDVTARECVDAAWDAGLRFFDTAPHYGLGLSERRLGDALRARPREEAVVSTKVGRVLEPDPRWRPGRDDSANGFLVPATLRRRADLTPAGVRRSLAQSLERLGLDGVDVALLHDPEEIGTPEQARAAVSTLRALREEGAVRAVGAGSKSAAALEALVRAGGLDVVMLAGRYTLLEQEAARGLLDLCAERGVAVVAVGVLNSGLLATPRPAPGATYEYGPAGREVLERAHRLADVCEEHGVTLPHAAVHFPLRHPAVANVTVGLRSPREVAELTHWVSTPVPEELWAALDTVGGPR